MTYKNLFAIFYLIDIHPGENTSEELLITDYTDLAKKYKGRIMMVNKDETICSVDWSKAKKSHKLTLTNEYLISELNDGSGPGIQHWHLEELSPMLNYTTGRERYFRGYMISSLITFGLAICFLFSSLNYHIPLLSPFTALLGLWLLFKGIMRRKIDKWTIFCKHNGDSATYITHGGCKKEELDKFEKCFVEAVKRAKDNK